MGPRNDRRGHLAPGARLVLACLLGLFALMLPLRGDTPTPGADSSDPHLEPPVRTLEVEGIAVTLLGEAFIFLAALSGGGSGSLGTESAAKERFVPPGQASCLW